MQHISLSAKQWLFDHYDWIYIKELAIWAPLFGVRIKSFWNDIDSTVRKISD